MNTADIRAYLYFELVEGKGKTPKYRLTKVAGYYPPLDKLKGMRGQGKDKVELFLLDAIDKNNGRAPETRLQAARSLNLTGFQMYWQDGKLSGYAFGNPPQGETYGNKKPLKNPFYPEFITDAFLFKFADIKEHKVGDVDLLLPGSFEMLVLANGKALAFAYCTQLKNGGFDNELAELRKQAKEV